MAAFSELDWSRFDVWAIVADAGLATIEERRRLPCLEWLKRYGYVIDSLDCSSGLDQAIPDLGRLLNWERKFGYVLQPDKRNLDALRDGFEFDIPEGGGRVFEVYHANRAWKEDRRWMLGLLSIAREQSRKQLALGRRFFTLLVLPEQSKLYGAVIEEVTIPGLFWNPCREVHEFIQ